MTSKKQVWKCEICGNIVEILHEGADSLVCCGQPMTLMKEKYKDEGKEKHVPIIENDKIKVGAIEHPMEEKHYIEWIEASVENGIVFKVFLKPGDKPEINAKNIKNVRAYCNKHGLWASS